MDSHFRPYWTHIRAVNQPFKSIGSGDLHLIVNSFENQMGAYSFKGSILRLYKAGRITTETALHCAMNPDRCKRSWANKFFMEPLPFSLEMWDKVWYTVSPVEWNFARRRFHQILGGMFP